VSDVKEEVFGPVLHFTRFAGDQIGSLVEEINELGFGLTMGLHSRIDSRVQKIAMQAKVGNLYVNRNQIGAVVGVQPFGGEGLSGTGPKAGGPHYLARLSIPSSAAEQSVEEFDNQLTVALPSPTGEKNTLFLHPRGRILCLGGDTKEDLARQVDKASSAGNQPIFLKAGEKIDVLVLEADIDAVASDHANRAEIAALLVKRKGPIIPLLSGHDQLHRYCLERTLTIDMTAAGGNAELLAAS
jgi:RHH-type proline utilization regulon transcriptional repressor/proline dehydrogenase/delta 1-pyrroline-5-carboxylate dehydrogenase